MCNHTCLDESQHNVFYPKTCNLSSDIFLNYVLSVEIHYTAFIVPKYNVNMLKTASEWLTPSRGNVFGYAEHEIDPIDFRGL